MSVPICDINTSNQFFQALPNLRSEDDDVVRLKGYDTPPTFDIA